MITIAVRAARRAGNIILRAADSTDKLSVSEKGRNDFVSNIDYQCEQEIVSILRQAYPQHGILAEEGSSHAGDEFQWIIDPLDGTTNFLHGYPQFAVSIGLLHQKRLTVGVVYDPLRQELFTASRGDGATLNDRKIRVSQVTHLKSALLGTGFPFKNPELLDTYLSTFKAVFKQSSGVRRGGSAALDLAYLAAGRLDGFWEFGLKPWDLAAGVLLIKEAGGMAGDFKGGESFLKTGNLVAGNPKVFKELLQTLKPLIPD